MICFLVVAVKNPAFAETETGNIEICIEDTGEQIKREGVTFQYSKVASLVDGAYEMGKRYEDKGVDLNEVRYAREQEELARTLSKYHYSDGLCRTDCDGKATLTNLRAGVYLIYVEDESEYEVQPAKCKAKVTDAKTGVKYEKYGHLSDCLDYLLCYYLRDSWTKYKRGDGSMTILSTATINEGFNY